MESFECTHRVKAQEVVVKDFFELRLPIVESGTVIEYKVWTEKCDIGFSVVLEDLEQNECAELVEHSRVDSHIEPICGRHGPLSADSFMASNSGGGDGGMGSPRRAPSSESRVLSPGGGQASTSTLGFVVLIFDNSYSWLRSKKLSYSVSLLQDPVAARDLRVNNIKRRVAACDDDIQRAERRSERAEEEKNELEGVMNNLKAELETVAKEINKKKASLDAIIQEQTYLAERMQQQRAIRGSLVERLVREESSAGSNASHDDGNSIPRHIEELTAEENEETELVEQDDDGEYDDL